MPSRVFIVRHGETEWSLSGQHTGLTDLPLTPHGEEEARQLGERLREFEFSSVLEHATHFVLGTAAIGILSNQHHSPHLPVIELWNWRGQL